RSPRLSPQRQDLAWIEQILRIQCPLQRAHQIQSHGILIVRQLFALDQAYAMFGRDGAVHPHDNVMHYAVEIAPPVQERLLVHAYRLAKIEMYVAIAEVAESANAKTRHRLDASGAGDIDEIGHARYRHRHIVLDRSALALLRLGHTL